jgi:hypothetical protein
VKCKTWLCVLSMVFAASAAFSWCARTEVVAAGRHLATSADSVCDLRIDAVIVRPPIDGLMRLSLVVRLCKEETHSYIFARQKLVSALSDNYVVNMNGDIDHELLTICDSIRTDIARNGRVPLLKPEDLITIRPGRVECLDVTIASLWNPPQDMRTGDVIAVQTFDEQVAVSVNGDLRDKVISCTAAVIFVR